MTDISKGYATALFMLGRENGQISEYADELNAVQNALESNPEYIGILRSPAIPKSERLSLIDEALSGCSSELIAFVKLLCEHGHINSFADCVTDYHELVRIFENRTVATVYYAHPLTDDQKTKLVEKLTQVSGKVVDAVYVEDKSLIGGIKVRMDDKLLDGSIAGRLKNASGVISE